MVAFLPLILLFHLVGCISSQNDMEKELETVHEAEERLKQDVFEILDGTPPKQKPVYVIPLMTVQHISSIDEDLGVLSLQMYFSFAWRDPRLGWKPSNYSGLTTITGGFYDFIYFDIWTPQIFLSDAIGRSGHRDLVTDGFVEFRLRSSGMIRVSVSLKVTTPCYFDFGDFPNDYQNCSFGLVTTTFADEVILAKYWDVTFVQQEEHISEVIKIQDFELLGFESETYFLYLGSEVVTDLTKYNPAACRPYVHYNIILKRVNHLIFYQLSTPMVSICVFVAMCGWIPNHLGLKALVFLIVVQIFFIVNVKQILPDDFNGTPTIVALAELMILETIALTCWKAFSIYVRKQKKQDSEIIIVQQPEYYNSTVLNIVVSVDKALMVMLTLQLFGNLYIIIRNS